MATVLSTWAEGPKNGGTVPSWLNAGPLPAASPTTRGSGSLRAASISARSSVLRLNCVSWPTTHIAALFEVRRMPGDNIESSHHQPLGRSASCRPGELGMRLLLEAATAAGITWSWDRHVPVWTIPPTPEARAAMAALKAHQQEILAEIVALRVQQTSLPAPVAPPVPPWLSAEPLAMALVKAGVAEDVAHEVAERLATAGISIGVAVAVVSALHAAGVLGRPQPASVKVPPAASPAPSPVQSESRKVRVESVRRMSDLAMEQP